MRWILTLLVLSTMLLTGYVVAKTPHAPASCTRVGTPQRDIMAGTGLRDVLCARAGNDYISGGGRRDILRGDGGNDTIVGGKGPDRLLGQDGNDKLFAVDGNASDVLDGGPGLDDCFGDVGDRFRGCERTFRGPTIVSTNALSSAFNGQGSLAEELIPPIPPPPGGTVTVTETITVAPNCGGHPAPPPICP